MDEWMKQLEHCMLCPRACGVNRITGNTGACHTDAQMRFLNQWLSIKASE